VSPIDSTITNYSQQTSCHTPRLADSTSCDSTNARNQQHSDLQTHNISYTDFTVDGFFDFPDLTEDFPHGSPSVDTESPVSAEGDNTSFSGGSCDASPAFTVQDFDVELFLTSDFTLFPGNSDTISPAVWDSATAGSTAAPTPASPLSATPGGKLVSSGHGPPAPPGASHSEGMSSQIHTPPSPSLSTHSATYSVSLPTPASDATLGVSHLEAADYAKTLPPLPTPPSHSTNRVRKRTSASKRSKSSRSPSADSDFEHDDTGGRKGVPDIIIVDKADPVAVKRARNTLAARRYRQKKVDRMQELEELLEETERERDEARRDAEHYKHEAEKYQMLFHVVQGKNAK